MNPSSEDDIEAQVNTLYRSREISFNSALLYVRYGDISKQFKISQGALHEEKTCLSYIENYLWPDGMEDLRINHLQFTVLDDAITENIGNGHSFLPSLKSGLPRVNPALSKRCEERNMQQTKTNIVPSDFQAADESCDNEKINRTRTTWETILLPHL